MTEVEIKMTKMRVSEPECLNECERTRSLFEVTFYDGAVEVHCNECLANVIREDPDCIKKVKNLRGD